MRNLFRNQREFYYATVVGTEPILDEYNNETLEVRTLYSSPTLLRGNISANIGEDTVNIFGLQSEYSRVVCFAGNNCPLTEGDKVWFGISTDKSNNYTVVKVADSKNGFLVALREVSARG